VSAAVNISTSVQSVKKSSGVENRGAEGVRGVVEGVCLSPLGVVWATPPQHFFYFKILHSGAFSYTGTNYKVLFAIKRRERYVITVFLATDCDTYMKTSSFHKSRKLILSQQQLASVSQLQ